MRAVLVDWLVDVGEELGLSDETIFLAVDLVDRYLSKEVRNSKIPETHQYQKCNPVDESGG